MTKPSHPQPINELANADHVVRKLILSGNAPPGLPHVSNVTELVTSEHTANPRQLL